MATLIKIIEADMKGNTTDTNDGTISTVQTLVNAGWEIKGVVPGQTNPFLIILQK